MRCSKENAVESGYTAIYSYPDLKPRMIMMGQTLQTRGSRFSHILDSMSTTILAPLNKNKNHQFPQEINRVPGELVSHYFHTVQDGNPL